MGHGKIGTEHLWAGIVREGEGMAAEVLTDLGVERAEVLNIVMSRYREAGATGWVSYSPGSTTVRGGFLPVPSRTRLQRFWYRYPGRWVFPLIAWLDCSVPGTKGRVGWISGIPRARPVVSGSIMEARRRAVSDVLEPRVPVGAEWTASLVRLGRGPEDFARAYDELKRIADRVGVDLDDSRVRVESVQTDQGPGLRLVLTRRFDEPEADRDESE